MLQADIAAGVAADTAAELVFPELPPLLRGHSFWMIYLRLTGGSVGEGVLIAVDIPIIFA